MERAKAGFDLDQAGLQLNLLNREWASALKTLGEHGSDDECLDSLAQKRQLRESYIQELARLRRQLQEKLPNGRGALEGELAAAVKAQTLVLERHPEFVEGKPSRQELEDRTERYRADRDRTNELERESETSMKLAHDELSKARASLQAEKERLAALKAVVQVMGESLERRGDQQAIEQRITECQRLEAQASLAAQECQLTDEERTVEERYKQAESAYRQRQIRSQEQKEEIQGLRGVLRGNEGLCTRLSDAEAALLETKRKLEREDLEAEAHKRLLELFDEARDQQIRQVMGPIAGRVLDWAGKIGLGAYQEVKFEEAYLPTGLIRSGAGSDTVVALEDESHGIHEQLALLVRLALGGILAKDEPAVAILDDPLSHTDDARHRRMLEIMCLAAEGNPVWNPPAGKLQILVFTCHPERFDYLEGVRHIDLAKLIDRDY
jgi:uncharacterized protein YhaN